ncbi:hypothetical protein GQ42DRAFT_38349 [Ramicandelaber brevisporus]|nr:hypothetical protein GQ42DRAFT_38349 [Ramicandelaber brevisporus]
MTTTTDLDIQARKKAKIADANGAGAGGDSSATILTVSPHFPPSSAKASAVDNFTTTTDDTAIAADGVDDDAYDAMDIDTIQVKNKGKGKAKDTSGDSNDVDDESDSGWLNAAEKMLNEARASDIAALDSSTISTSASPVPDIGPAAPVATMTPAQRFGNFRLRRIIRENHNTDVNLVSFCVDRRLQQRLLFERSSGISTSAVGSSSGGSGSGGGGHRRTGSSGVRLGMSFDGRYYGSDGQKKNLSGNAQTGGSAPPERPVWDTSNLVATAGAGQVTVYDNGHCGDHLDIVSQFHLQPSGNEKIVATAIAWLTGSNSGNEDVMLIVGTSTGSLALLSLAWSRQIGRAESTAEMDNSETDPEDILIINKDHYHEKEIIHIEPHPTDPNVFATSSIDGTIRLWSIIHHNNGLETDIFVDIVCYAIIPDAKSSIIRFSPDGNSIIVGGLKTELAEYTTVRSSSELLSTPVEVLLSNPAMKRIETAKRTIAIPDSKAGGGGLGALMDSSPNPWINGLQLIDAVTVFATTSNGRGHIISLLDGTIIRSFKVPRTSESSGTAAAVDGRDDSQQRQNRIQYGAINSLYRSKRGYPSHFHMSSDGEFAVFGIATGAIVVVSLHSGKSIVELRHRRSNRPLHSCAMSANGESIIAGGEGGYLWRYDFTDDKTLESWANWHITLSAP